MAKHIIHIIGTFLIFAAIVNGINGQCTASDFCCATTSGNGDWTKPQGANDAYVTCNIRGNNIISTDCPTGWIYAAGGQWASKCKYHPFNGNTSFGSVKSCAASNSCPSVENVCNNINLTAVRAGLYVVVSCISQGSVNIPVCPIGWERKGCTRCDKEFRPDENYNDTRAVTDNSTCNATVLPDYSAVCENPQTYNKSNIIPGSGMTCQNVIQSLTITGGCLAHINWETATYSNFANLTGTKNGMDCTTINFTSWGCCSATPTSSTQQPTTNTPTTTSTNTNTTTQAPTTSTNTNTTTAASEGTLDTSAATMTARGHFVFMLLSVLGVMYWF